MLRFSWHTLNWITYISYQKDIINLLMSSTAVFFFVILHQSIQLCYMWGTYNGLRCSYKFQHACSEKRKAIVLAQCSLTNGFKLQSKNCSPTRAGSLYEKSESDWKNSTNSHLLRDVFFGSYGSVFFLNFHYAPYKKSYCIDVGNPEATRKAL